MVNKNEEYTLTIEDLSYQGFGVAKVDGFTVFVEGTLAGEKVTIKIVKVLKNFAFGKVVEILETSPERVEITDKVGYQTGTMPLQHLSYGGQLKFKREQVVHNFKKRFKDLDESIIKDTIGMDNPWGYRNKAQIPVRRIDGVVQTGFYKRNSHDLVPVDNYYIQEPEIDEAILVIRDMLNEYSIDAYNEETHTGEIRHVVVRRSHANGGLMIIFVTLAANEFTEEFILELVTKIPAVVSIVQNINHSKTNVIMGKRDRLVWGQEFIEDKLLGKTFRISPQSFFQINTIQTEKLYAKAIEYAQIKKNDVVLDAYCGLGSITLNLADKAKFVYGVEVVPQAIAMAQMNAEINGATNVEFVLGKSEDVMLKWAEEEKQFNTLVMDPPRKGLEGAFIEASLVAQPQRIVYVSCNPDSCARDVAIYLENGYQIEEITPVDMFPQTLHVETVVLMSRK